MATPRKKDRGPVKQTNLTLPLDVWQLLDATARRFGLSKAKMCALLLRDFLARLAPEDRQVIDKLRVHPQKPGRN